MQRVNGDAGGDRKKNQGLDLLFDTYTEIGMY